MHLLIYHACTHVCIAELAGCIRSWENDPGHGGVPGEVKVVADNMMNLELLFAGSRLTGDNRYAAMAISHARQNIANHMRPGGSSFHVVAYNETTGDIRRKYTHQGFSDSSTWARGHAWIIHGFGTCYRQTGITEFLRTAEEAAQWFIDRLPEDAVPFWDFDVASFSVYQPRDTSAAAVGASGLLELYDITKKAVYLETAERILTSLSSAKYRADGNMAYRIPAVLVNGTQFYNENNFNTAIVYGDYYYLQAIYRYRNYVPADPGSSTTTAPTTTTLATTPTTTSGVTPTAQQHFFWSSVTTTIVLTAMQAMAVY